MVVSGWLVLWHQATPLVASPREPGGHSHCSALPREPALGRLSPGPALLQPSLGLDAHLRLPRMKGSSRLHPHFCPSQNWSELVLAWCWEDRHSWPGRLGSPSTSSLQPEVAICKSCHSEQAPRED